jgi:hypothetical protein
VKAQEDHEQVRGGTHNEISLMVQGVNETAGRRLTPPPLRGESDGVDGTLRGSPAQMSVYYLFIRRFGDDMLL